MLSFLEEPAQEMPDSTLLVSLTHTRTHARAYTTMPCEFVSPSSTMQAISNPLTPKSPFPCTTGTASTHPFVTHVILNTLISPASGSTLRVDISSPSPFHSGQRSEVCPFQGVQRAVHLPKRERTKKKMSSSRDRGYPLPGRRELLDSQTNFYFYT